MSPRLWKLSPALRVQLPNPRRPPPAAHITMARYPSFSLSVLCLSAVAWSLVSARPILPPDRECPLVNVGVCCRNDGNAGPAFSKVANKCVCDLNGGTVVPAGSCAPVATPRLPELPSCICTMIYKPVCCIANGIPSVASNSCVCKCRGGQATLLYFKECANIRGGFV
jgi:hypothetical protein